MPIGHSLVALYIALQAKQTAVAQAHTADTAPQRRQRLKHPAQKCRMQHTKVRLQGDAQGKSRNVRLMQPPSYYMHQA